MITKSTIIYRSVQADGRIYVIESHMDDVQGEIQYLYLASKDADLDKIMTDRADYLNNLEPDKPDLEALAQNLQVATDQYNDAFSKATPEEISSLPSLPVLKK
jgi:hypothetical protein